LPSLRQLNPLAHEAADFAMSEKEKREDWKRYAGISKGKAGRLQKDKVAAPDGRL
jgi:hypothetical protein